MILKNVQDLRFHPRGYSEVSKQLILGIATTLANEFLCKIALYSPAQKWRMPGTEILNIICEGFKINEFSNYTKIGDRKIDWISEVRVHMEEEDFLKQDERGKQTLILNKLREGIYKFIYLCKEHSFNQGIIDKVHNEIKNNDFYTQYGKVFISKDGRFELCLEYQPRSTTWRYQAVLKDNGIASPHFLVDEKNISLVEMFAWKSIKSKGWKKYKFHFDYSSVEEKAELIFDADTKAIEIRKLKIEKR